MDDRVKTIYEDIWALCLKAFEIAKISPIAGDRDLLKPEEFSILLSSGEYQASLDVYQALYEYEMVGFLIYLGLSGGSMSDEELQFIKEYDSICKKPKFTSSLGQASPEAFSNSVGRIFDVNFYKRDVPYVFKTAVEADLTRIQALGEASFSERLYNLFLRLGEEFLARGRDESGLKAYGFARCMGIVKKYIETSVGAENSLGLASQAPQTRPGDDLGGASPTVLLESGYNDARDFDGRSESPLSFGEQFCRFLTDYPESIRIRQKFLGLLRDVFPEHRLQTNLLSILHGMGIAAEIENSPRIDSAFAFRFEKRLTEEYGIVQNYAEWAVSVWCESYGRRVLGRQCDMSVNPSEDRSG